MVHFLKDFVLKIRHLVKKNSYVYKAVYIPYHLYVTNLVKFKTWYIYGRDNDAEVNPYSVIYVDPNEIWDKNKMILNDKKERKYSHILNGNWDMKISSFNNNWVYRGFKEHFEEGKAWKKTIYYRKWQERIKDGPARGIESEEDILERCKKMDKLYKNIKEKGFKSGEELRKEKIISPVPQDVAVAIGRDGKIIYVTGKHRLSIAKLLGLEQIPVRVVIRHEKWQNIRNKFAQAEKIGEVKEEIRSYKDHPDVNHLL